MGKEKIWTKKNGAGYECGIPLNQKDQPITSTRGSSEGRHVLAVEMIVTHEGALVRLVRNTDWNAVLRVVNTGVSVARTRPRCPQRMLNDDIHELCRVSQMVKCAFLCRCIFTVHAYYMC